MAEELPFLDGVQEWSFRGVAFAARAPGDADWDEWFEETTIFVSDPILDSNDRFTDVAGVNYGQVQRLAAFDTVEERAAFAAMRGSTGVLARPGGGSRQALLSRTKAVSSGTNSYFLLDVTFDAV